MPRFAQARRTCRVASKELTPAIVARRSSASTRELGEHGRVLVRPSGTEPMIRVLVEAENGQLAGAACATIAALVESELG